VDGRRWAARRVAWPEKIDRGDHGPHISGTRGWAQRQLAGAGGWGAVCGGTHRAPMLSKWFFNSSLELLRTDGVTAPPLTIVDAGGSAANVAPQFPQSGTLMGAQPSPALRFRWLVRQQGRALHGTPTRRVALRGSAKSLCAGTFQHHRSPQRRDAVKVKPGPQRMPPD